MRGSGWVPLRFVLLLNCVIKIIQFWRPGGHYKTDDIVQINYFHDRLQSRVNLWRNNPHRIIDENIQIWRCVALHVKIWCVSNNSTKIVLEIATQDVNLGTTNQSIITLLFGQNKIVWVDVMEMCPPIFDRLIKVNPLLRPWFPPENTVDLLIHKK